MKKYLLMILMAATIFALSGCGSGSSSPAATDKGTEEGTEAVAEEDGGQQAKEAGEVTVEIVPPDGWDKVEGSILEVQYLKGTASFMVKPEAYTSDTLDGVVEEAKEIFSGSFDEFTVVGEPEPVTVDEKDARRLTFTCKVSNIPMKFMYVFLFAADNTYVITFGDQASTFDSLSDDYEKILEDIRFRT